MRIIRGLIGLPFYLVAGALSVVAFLLFSLASFVRGEDEPFLDYPVEWE